MPPPSKAAELSILAKHEMAHRATAMRDQLSRLRDRMVSLNWPTDDPILVAVAAARDALHAYLLAIYPPQREVTPGDPSEYPEVVVPKRRRRRR